MSTYPFISGSYPDGATALLQLAENTPIGASDPVSDVDDAIQQIKKYLKDIKGPQALIDALTITVGNIPAMLDEDDMISDSDTNTASQQSVKAYSDGITTAMTALANLKILGPGSVTDGDIVQFDGTTGLAVKGGLALTTDVDSGSLDTEVPSAKACYDAVVAISYPGVKMYGLGVGAASSTTAPTILDAYTATVHNDGFTVSEANGTITALNTGRYTIKCHGYALNCHALSLKLYIGGVEHTIGGHAVWAITAEDNTPSSHPKTVEWNHDLNLTAGNVLSFYGAVVSSGNDFEYLEFTVQQLPN